MTKCILLVPVMLCTWQVTAFAAKFNGCGGGSAADMDGIIFLNSNPAEQSICVDNISLEG
jgi:hypothetical protein